MKKAVFALSFAFFSAGYPLSVLAQEAALDAVTPPTTLQVTMDNIAAADDETWSFLGRVLDQAAKGCAHAQEQDGEEDAFGAIECQVRQQMADRNWTLLGEQHNAVTNLTMQELRLAAAKAEADLTTAEAARDTAKLTAVKAANELSAEIAKGIPAVVAEETASMTPGEELAEAENELQELQTFTTALINEAAESCADNDNRLKVCRLPAHRLAFSARGQTTIDWDTIRYADQ